MAIPYAPWQGESLVASARVECLLPTGLYLTLPLADRKLTLAALKLDLWKEALKYPFYCFLEQAADYVFVGVTADAPFKQEFYDESRPVVDLRLFLPVLQLKEVEGNRGEKEAVNVISEVCGINVGDFSTWTDQEPLEYRHSLLSITKEVVQFRHKGGQKALASYFYPSQLESEDTFIKDMGSSLEGDVDVVLVPPVTRRRLSYRINVSYKDMPNDVVFRCLQLAVGDLTDAAASEAPGVYPEKYFENYVLKVCGRECYFLKSSPFIQYKYIRNNLAHKKPVKLTLIKRDDLYSGLDPAPMSLPSIVHRPAPQSATKNATSTWKIDRLFRVKPTGVMKLSGTGDKLFVRMGLYVGTDPLCPNIDSPEVSYNNPRWNDHWMVFEISISQIPQAAKLCVAVCATLARKQRKEKPTPDKNDSSQSATSSRTASMSRAKREHIDYVPLAYANINLFNARGELLNEQMTIGLFPTVRDSLHILNPCGPIGSNTNKENGGHLTVRFDQSSLVLPPNSQMLELGAKITKEKTTAAGQKEATQLSLEDNQTLKILARKDPLYELNEQEKEFIWRYRDICPAIPEILPKLLGAVRWSSRDEVAELYIILQRWPFVSPVVALELLDCKYPDMEVRKFAIRSLHGCPDSELERYLLPLTQVLKYEPHLNSPIAHFVLRRGLQNRRVGQLLFWLLKAEMHDNFVYHRFGCILEALCRGSGAYTKALGRQVGALNKLKDLSSAVAHGEEGKRFVTDQLKLAENVATLQGIPSPLDCDDTLGELISSECKVLASAKKPLWLVWNNPDPLADLYYPKHALIFKNGDDLRQDMLTLQTIALMDNIWQTEGLNLRLIPYGCLPTGRNMGVIEVVRNAKTVMTIQKQKGGMRATMQVDNFALFKWLKEINQSKTQYDRAVENFTYSCAGYCVATFILGIGDRHPDNIMVTESGQMFHIDFGHFLGHFKKKFGINRERVPFVLTRDFINVIAKGSESPEKTTEYDKFKQLCCDAYQIMRKNSNLIITLFTMMLSTGIPELQSLDDVSYLRNTLAVDKTDEDALTFFGEKMNEAFWDAWTTKVDWFFHGVKHLNT